jgi:hypothetical protein
MTYEKNSRTGIHDPEKIVEEALKTLGLSRPWLADLMDIPEAELKWKLNFQNLGALDWFWISEALYFSSDMVSYGYVRDEHKGYIRWAMREETFHLPLTWAQCKIRFQFWKEILFELLYQSRHYGFRLRWKIRSQNFMIWFRKKLTLTYSVNPVHEARNYFRQEKISQTIDSTSFLSGAS